MFLCKKKINGRELKGSNYTEHSKKTLTSQNTEMSLFFMKIELNTDNAKSLKNLAQVLDSATICSSAAPKATWEGSSRYGLGVSTWLDPLPQE